MQLPLNWIYNFAVVNAIEWRMSMGMCVCVFCVHNVGMHKRVRTPHALYQNTKHILIKYPMPPHLIV